MIYFPQTKGFVSRELPVATGQAVAAEGQAIVAVNGTDGSFGGKPSAGTAGEQFLGVAVSQQITITSKAAVEDFTVPVGLTVTLNQTPSAGTISVYNNTTGAVIPSSGAAGTFWTLSGSTITLPSGNAGASVTVYYKYAVSAAMSRYLQGDTFPGGAAGAVVNQIGLIKNGIVYTDQFDSTVNWNVANPVVTLGANGQFTIGGSGTVINCSVVHAPSSGSAFLGLDLNY
jgi:hypothetical protein